MREVKLGNTFGLVFFWRKGFVGFFVVFREVIVFLIYIVFSLEDVKFRFIFMVRDVVYEKKL